MRSSTLMVGSGRHWLIKLVFPEVYNQDKSWTLLEMEIFTPHSASTSGCLSTTLVLLINVLQGETSYARIIRKQAHYAGLIAHLHARGWTVIGFTSGTSIPDQRLVKNCSLTSSL